MITESNSWTLDTLQEAEDIILNMAEDHLGFDLYPTQTEIITSEQMLDLYSLTGLPLSYNHWSFGKKFVKNQQDYLSGKRGLAYEIVPNTNPVRSYQMETNNTVMQFMVMAHVTGHNHFFKNNYMFTDWTDADFIVDYLRFAKDYVRDCERKYGEKEVEKVIDACHTIQRNSVDFHPRNRKGDSDKPEPIYDEMWETLLPQKQEETTEQLINEDNLLYFLEKNSLVEASWKRELMRIVRKLGQYFFPQAQTKNLNEGCASYADYHLMTKMYDDGHINEGFYMEYLHHHSNVLNQPDYGQRMNPYKLGFEVLMDVKRMIQDPTDEDKNHFPEVTSQDSWKEYMLHIFKNYRDDSFIQQFLSPKLIRKLGFFKIEDYDDQNWIVTEIQDDKGWKQIRKDLASSYKRANMFPNVKVKRVDGRTKLLLQTDDPIHQDRAKKVLKHLESLWGNDEIYLEQHDGKLLTNYD